MIVIHFTESKKKDEEKLKKKVSNNTSNAKKDSQKKRDASKPAAKKTPPKGKDDKKEEKPDNMSLVSAQEFSQSVGGAAIINQNDDSGIYSTRVDFNAALSAKDNVRKALQLIGFKDGGSHNNGRFISMKKKGESVYYTYNPNQGTFQLLFVDDNNKDAYQNIRKIEATLAI